MLICALLLTGACRAPDDTAITDADADGFADTEDCNDADASVYPGNAESCNGVDDNCNGLIDDNATDTTTYFLDRDADGYGDTANPTSSCDQPQGYVSDSSDCDDSDDSIFPSAPEIDCTDAIDYNCDGSSGFQDVDGDGYAACQDCDDTLAGVNADAIETCDAVDNDCDGAVDEAGALGSSNWYADDDGDGFGDAFDMVTDCVAPTGYLSDNRDCNDTEAAAYPGGTEVCDSIDNDCDGNVDGDATDAGTWYADGDGDGFGNHNAALVACSAPLGFVADDTDCDDDLPGTYPNATEVCDTLDNNCNGIPDEDFDADGDGVASCGGDCDDNEIAVFPGAGETCNGVDDDCDGSVDESASDMATFYVDADGDGHGNAAISIDACAAPAGFTAAAGDCDDLDSAINPAGTEACDGDDNNCDGSVDEGFDTDIDGYTTCGGDCDDGDVAINPDTLWYLDYDDDGYGDAAWPRTGCAAPAGYVMDATDCDDLNSIVNPGASLACDGTDADCDGAIDNDVDLDGYSDGLCGGLDCDDNDAAAKPEVGGGCAIGVSCDDVLSKGLDAGDGLYTLDPDGFGTGIGPADYWCDMDSYGGGWTRFVTMPNSASYTGLQGVATTETYVDNGTFQFSTDMMKASNREVLMLETVGPFRAHMYDFKMGTNVAGDNFVGALTGDVHATVGIYNFATSTYVVTATAGCNTNNHSQWNCIPNPGVRWHYATRDWMGDGGSYSNTTWSWFTGYNSGWVNPVGAVDNWNGQYNKTPHDFFFR